MGYARVKANQALIAESRVCRVGPHRNNNPKIKHSTQKNEPCVGSSSRKTKHFVSSRSPFLPQTSIHSAVKYQFHPSIHPSIHPFNLPILHPLTHIFIRIRSCSVPHTGSSMISTVLQSLVRSRNGSLEFPRPAAQFRCWSPGWCGRISGPSESS